MGVSERECTGHHAPPMAVACMGLLSSDDLIQTLDKMIDFLG
jgi:hypothetical protein